MRKSRENRTTRKWWETVDLAGAPNWGAPRMKCQKTLIGSREIGVVELVLWGTPPMHLFHHLLSTAVTPLLLPYLGILIIGFQSTAASSFGKNSISCKSPFHLLLKTGESLICVFDNSLSPLFNDSSIRHFPILAVLVPVLLVNTIIWTIVKFLLLL